MEKKPRILSAEAKLEIARALSVLLDAVLESDNDEDLSNYANKLQISTCTLKKYIGIANSESYEAVAALPDEMFPLHDELREIVQLEMPSLVNDRYVKEGLRMLREEQMLLAKRKRNA